LREETGGKEPQDCQGKGRKGREDQGKKKGRKEEEIRKTKNVEK